MAELKNLQDVLSANKLEVPKFLVVKIEQDGYHRIPGGQEVYSVEKDKAIHKMELAEDGKTYELPKPSEVVLAEKGRVLYLNNGIKDPYNRRGPVSVKISEDADVNRAMLELFIEFTRTRNEVGVLVLTTARLAELEPPKSE